MQPSEEATSQPDGELQTLKVDSIKLLDEIYDQYLPDLPKDLFDASQKAQETQATLLSKYIPAQWQQLETDS